MLNRNFLLVFYGLFLILLDDVVQKAISQSTQEEYNEEIKSPCRLAKQRRYPKGIPFMRLVEEDTGPGPIPDVILGRQGIQYFMLPGSRKSQVVIECSSSLGSVEWVYNGPGASSGLKVVTTRWSSSSPGFKSSCHSAALIISNNTDQITGEYTCKHTSEQKKASENQFVLFVPQSSQFYHQQGSSVNISVPSWIGDLADPINLPCISKRRSGAGISLYRVTDEDGLIKMKQGDTLRFDPFQGFKLTPTKDLFSNGSEAKFICKFDKNLSGFDGLANTTLLNITLKLQSDEKVAPQKPLVLAYAPYFSWTTKQNPKLKFIPDVSPNAVIWQQLYTKLDHEETSPWTQAFYLGSVQLVNLTEGSEGQVILYDGNKNPEDGLIHKWQYKIINKLRDDLAGLSYEVIDGVHIFTCIASTDTKPVIKLVELYSDELLVSDDVNNTIKNSTFTIENCLKDEESCVLLTTVLPQGEVTCVGDGVDRSIRFPLNSQIPSRPFLIERGETIDIVAQDTMITLPCLPNNPDAKYFINLFKATKSGYEKLWSLKTSKEKASEAIEFSPNWGFHIDTSYPGNFTGEYICTSSEDLSDKSDVVTVRVLDRKPEKLYEIIPKSIDVFGIAPFTFSWESKDDAEVEDEAGNIIPSESLTNLSVSRKVKQQRFKGRLVYNGTDEMEDGTVRKLLLVSKSDNRTILHTWNVHKISSTLNSTKGLKVETKILESGEYTVTMKCRSASEKKPRLNYFFCQSPNSCDLMKRCGRKNCNPPIMAVENTSNSDIESCSSSAGCESTITLKSIALNGFLKVFCTGDGVKDQKTISDVFFREDIHWNTDEDQDLIYLYVNMPDSTDQNPLREVRSIGSNVDWGIGDTVIFSCGAAPFLFTNGIKWAVETKDGSLIYEKDSAFDPQYKYLGTTQVLSTFSLNIDSFDVKRVWCFVPTLSSPVKWRNISQPIFVRQELDENCHNIEPSIRLLNVYPPPSKIPSFNVDDPRLDKKPFFVLPTGVKQMGVKVTAPEPVEWSFLGFAAGPTMTPLIQSDRQTSDFYDPSTYCYTSRLLLNLRNTSSSNDTGRYYAKYKFHPEITLSFYLFVPSLQPPFLLRSGSEVNESCIIPDRQFYLPCLVNNPEKTVALFKKNLTNGGYDKLELNDNISYDPTLGFIFTGVNSSNLIGEYKCIADGNQGDFLIVNVVAPQERKSELKHEVLGEIHLFTCTSSSNSTPFMNFTDTNSVESNAENSTKLYSMHLSNCSSGCQTLMTTAKQGIVHCIGEGIEEHYRYPSVPNGLSRSSDSTKSGLWYDDTVDAFRCQTNAVIPPKLVAVICRRPNECEIMSNLLRGDGDQSQATSTVCGEGCSQLKLRKQVYSQWPSNWFSVFVRCKGDDNVEIISPFFQALNGSIVPATKENVEKFRQIRLDLINLQTESNLIHAKFRCYANRYFSSRGIQWGFEKRSGAMVFKDSQREIEIQNFGSTMSEITLDFKKSQYKAVWCFVPMLDSSKWSNATISFPIDSLVMQKEVE